MVIVTASITPGNNNSALASFAVGGSCPGDASDERAVIASDSQILQRMSTVTIVTGLTPGSNTFTMCYRRTGGNPTFADRTLTVIPLN